MEIGTTFSAGVTRQVAKIQGFGSISFQLKIDKKYNIKLTSITTKKPGDQFLVLF
jgi:hypothetical protein